MKLMVLSHIEWVVLISPLWQRGVRGDFTENFFAFFIIIAHRFLNLTPMPYTPPKRGFSRQ